MRRSVLFSLLIIGAAISVVVGSGTFGAFSDTENIDGTVTSAIVDFELSGDGTNTGDEESDLDETLTITFDALGETCGFDFFAPGDDCTIEIALTRAAGSILQQLAVDLSVTNFTVEGVTEGDASISTLCDNGGAGADHWTVSYAFNDTSGDADFMPAGVDDPEQEIHVTVALDEDAPNSCQNDILSPISITIQALQDDIDPHATPADTQPTP